jgi:hypothetical protein
MIPFDMIVVMGSVSVGSYILLLDERKKYGNRKSTQEAHLGSLALPLWAVVYAAAVPTAIIVRLIHGPVRHTGT